MDPACRSGGAIDRGYERRAQDWGEKKGGGRPDDRKNYTTNELHSDHPSSKMSRGVTRGHMCASVEFRGL